MENDGDGTERGAVRGRDRPLFCERTQVLMSHGGGALFPRLIVGQAVGRIVNPPSRAALRNEGSPVLPPGEGRNPVGQTIVCCRLPRSHRKLLRGMAWNPQGATSQKRRHHLETSGVAACCKGHYRSTRGGRPLKNDGLPHELQPPIAGGFC